MGTTQRICDVTKNDTFVSGYFIASEKLVSIKTLLCVFCQSKNVNILLPVDCRHLFHDEFCQKWLHLALSLYLSGIHIAEPVSVKTIGTYILIGFSDSLVRTE